MLIAARSLPHGHTLHGDVCIVGGGPAGLTLAHQLARGQARVIVVESGGHALRQATQSLHCGEVAGQPYYPLDACRYRLLGGSTARWGGWCRPLDGLDFEPRAWVADSGWPFPRAALDPFYRRAEQLLRNGAKGDGAARWGARTSTRLLPDGEDAFENVEFELHPSRFGDIYGPIARRSRHFDLLLNATVLGLEIDRKESTISAARVATVGRKPLTIRANVFVLAAGGIENARILLVSESARGRSPGNDYDLVGRYFADHMHVPLGVLRAEDGAADFYQARTVDGVKVRGGVVATEHSRRRVRGLGFAATLHNADDPHDVLSLAQTNDGYLSLQHLVRSVRHGHLPDRARHHIGVVLGRPTEVSRLVYRRFFPKRGRTFLIGCRAEQAPNRDSRVTLDTRCDALGVRQVRLDWRLSPADLENIEAGQRDLARALSAHQVEMFAPVTSRGNGGQYGVAGGAHHMGTTRMHRDARHGVVDEHCRVHGTDNLYVTGSSVFPTGGWAPPTLTILALAMRLGEHLGAGNRAGTT